MDLSAETRRKLRDMGAADLLCALEAQDEGMCMGMTCAERVQMAVDEAHSSFVTLIPSTYFSPIAQKNRRRSR